MWNIQIYKQSNIEIPYILVNLSSRKRSKLLHMRMITKIKEHEKNEVIHFLTYLEYHSRIWSEACLLYGILYGLKDEESLPVMNPLNCLKPGTIMLANTFPPEQIRGSEQIRFYTGWKCHLNLFSLPHKLHYNYYLLIKPHEIYW